MIRFLQGDCREVLRTLPDASVQCCVTSPPYYGLRDYGVVGQLGLEATPAEYLATMVAVFREVRRVLRDDGTCWVNMGDSYATNGGAHTSGSYDEGVGRAMSAGLPRRVPEFRPGSGRADGIVDDRGQRNRNGTAAPGYKPKDLLMMPARLALALQADGWWLRSDIIWAKPNPMPESVTDRPTNAHEHVFLLTKRSRYYFDSEAVREEAEYGRRDTAGAWRGRNLRNVWTIATAPFSGWAETSRQVRVAWDAGVDGMKRKASPDCPVHAGQSGPVPMGSGGGHVADPLDHTGRSDIGHVPSLLAGCEPTDLRHVPPTASMSDLLGQHYAPSAIGHSSQSHRTDPAPATSPACSVSAQTADDTGCTSASPWLSGSADRMPESNIEQDGSDGHPSAQIGDHSADMSSCSCEWYITKTEKTSHFATFPPELAERCIRAGTSQAGCCAQCGKPWVRTTDVSYTDAHRGMVGNQVKAITDSMVMHAGREQDKRLDKHVTTTGWSPGCQCNAGATGRTGFEPAHTHFLTASPAAEGRSTAELPTERVMKPPTLSGRSEEVMAPSAVPCIVLDPFSGAGTALLVADRLGRDAIGIELNPEYVEMSRKRVMEDQPLFAEVAAE